MITTKDLIKRYNGGENLPLYLFWGHYPSKHGITKSCLSQWWQLHPFYENNIKFQTAEHYMMYHKAVLFGDYGIATEILKVNTPREAKKYGRKVAYFRSDVWDKHKRRIVFNGNLEKFSQHKDLRQFLLGTGDSILVEASPYDRIWGVGLKSDDKRIVNPNNWQGDNLLGFILMEVREHLKNN